MTDIVERLRAITGQAGDHGDVQLCDEAAAEIERLRLTEDERTAIQWVLGEALSADGVSVEEALRGLLERTKTVTQ